MAYLILKILDTTDQSLKTRHIFQHLRKLWSGLLPSHCWKIIFTPLKVINYVSQKTFLSFLTYSIGFVRAEVSIKTWLVVFIWTSFDGDTHHYKPGIWGCQFNSIIKIVETFTHNFHYSSHRAYRPSTDTSSTLKLCVALQVFSFMW